MQFFRWSKMAIVDGLRVSRQHLPALIAAVSIAVVLALLGLLVSQHGQIPYMRLLRDANAMAGVPWYYAGLENAGILILAFLTGGTLLAGSLVRRPLASFLWGGGLLSIILFIDDMYMVHEQAYLIGLSDSKVFAIYGLILAGLILTHLDVVRRTPILILAMSLGCFGMSAVLDRFESLATMLYAGEDLLELLAVTLWGTYFFTTGLAAVREQMPIKKPPPSSELNAGGAAHVDSADQTASSISRSLEGSAAEAPVAAE